MSPPALPPPPPSSFMGGFRGGEEGAVLYRINPLICSASPKFGGGGGEGEEQWDLNGGQRDPQGGAQCVPPHVH